MPVWANLPPTGTNSLLPPRPPSPGYPQQRLGGQEGEHTLHHLREVTQHVGTPRVSEGGGGGGAAAAAHQLHSSPTRQKRYGSSLARTRANRRTAAHPSPLRRRATHFRRVASGTRLTAKAERQVVTPAMFGSERYRAVWPLNRRKHFVYSVSLVNTLALKF